MSVYYILSLCGHRTGLKEAMKPVVRDSPEQETGEDTNTETCLSIFERAFHCYIVDECHVITAFTPPKKAVGP